MFNGDLQFHVGKPSLKSIFWLTLMALNYMYLIDKGLMLTLIVKYLLLFDDTLAAF
jgi:hypothetical protein